LHYFVFSRVVVVVDVEVEVVAAAASSDPSLYVLAVAVVPIEHVAAFVVVATAIGITIVGDARCTIAYHWNAVRATRSSAAGPAAETAAAGSTPTLTEHLF